MHNQIPIFLLCFTALSCGESPGGTPQGETTCPERTGKTLVRVPEAESDGVCAFEIEVREGAQLWEPSCAVQDELCVCELTLEPAQYSVDIEHADGREGETTFQYSPPACGSFVVEIELGGKLRTEDCDLLCETAAECPPTSLGAMCIGGCCAKD